MPLFHWVGYDIKTVAIPLGILLSATSKLFALPQYQRHHLIDWKGAWPMMIAALVLAPIGAMTTPFIPKNVVLWGFVGILLVAAVRTLFVVRQPDPDTELPWIRRAVLGSLVTGGAAFIGGLLGFAGGFIISPLLIWMGYPAKKSAATTAAIAAVSSLAGFTGHTTHMAITGGILVLTLVGATAGSVAGSWFMANKVKPSWIKTLYGLILIGVAGQLAGEPLHLGNVLTAAGVIFAAGYLLFQVYQRRRSHSHMSAS